MVSNDIQSKIFRRKIFIDRKTAATTTVITEEKHKNIYKQHFINRQSLKPDKVLEK